MYVFKPYKMQFSLQGCWEGLTDAVANSEQGDKSPQIVAGIHWENRVSILKYSSIEQIH